jgi:excisionase family DNA binding protein
MKLLSAKDVAKRLNVHPVRVKTLIREGRLKAQKIAGAWIINEKDLKKLKILKRGRPRKNG